MIRGIPAGRERAQAPEVITRDRVRARMVGPNDGPSTAYEIALI